MSSSLQDLLSQIPNPIPNPEPSSDPYSFSSSATVVSLISLLSSYSSRLLSNPSPLRDICFHQSVVSNVAVSVITNLKNGVEGVHRVAAAADREYVRLGSLRSCISLLSVVEGIGCEKRKTGSGPTAGVDDRVTACAHLYLALAYRIQRKDRASARHLLQVFLDAPYFARKTLLPDLWDRMFLPHLLHIKLWYTKEVSEISVHDDVEFREQKMKLLEEDYNDKMDNATCQFALYYKDWIKVDATQAPPIPSTSMSLLKHEGAELQDLMTKERWSDHEIPQGQAHTEKKPLSTLSFIKSVRLYRLDTYHFNLLQLSLQKAFASVRSWLQRRSR